MKILQINVVLNTGSTGRIVEGINTVIQSFGGESYCYYGRGTDNNSTSISYGPNSIWDIYHHVFISRLFDKHGLGSKESTLKLVSIIKDIKPHVIHLHNIHGYYLNYPILFKFLEESKIPIVWTLHDCWSFTGHCVHFEDVNCKKWQSGCNNCPQIRSYPSSFYIDNSKNNFQLKKKHFNLPTNITFIAVSKWLQKHLQKSFLSAHECLIINNGIDLRLFNYVGLKQQKANNNRNVILGVTNVWTKDKGLYDFYKLADLLGDDYEVLLVGLTKSQLNKLPVNISGFERTSTIEELVKLYATSMVLVNPTYSDTFPTTNLEALACGTPVITYNTGGSPEAIDDQTGFVVDKGDIESLIEKIEIIKSKGKKYYQPLCRARAVKYFNKDDRYLDYIALYKKLINENTNK